MKTEAIYKVRDEVIVSGSFTGIGDVLGVIYEVEYNSLSKEYFYLVKASESTYWSQERFLINIGL